VLAADSRVTLTSEMPTGPGKPPVLIPATYDNAKKLLQINRQPHVGVVTYGAGAIGSTQPRTAHSYVPEFEALIGGSTLKVSEFAQRLSDFFKEQWASSMPPDYQGPDMTFLVGGYDPGETYGRLFEIYIPRKPTPNEFFTGAGEFGMVWGGQREFADRVMQGFDDRLPFEVQQFLQLSDDQRNALREHLRNRLNAAIPYAFLPLQDCIDLTMFLIRTTAQMHKWWVGVRGVGGAIDVATITGTEGFKIVQQKIIAGER